MVAPLVAQKTDARSGVIVNAEGPPEKRPRTGARARAIRDVGLLGSGSRATLLVQSLERAGRLVQL